MKNFEVYNSRKPEAPLASFDTVNEAMAYAKKGLRGSSRRIYSTVYKMDLCIVSKSGRTSKYLVCDLRK